MHFERCNVETLTLEVGRCGRCKSWELAVFVQETPLTLTRLGYHDYGPFDGLDDVLVDAQRLVSAWTIGGRDLLLEVWPTVG